MVNEFCFGLVFVRKKLQNWLTFKLHKFTIREASRIVRTILSQMENNFVSKNHSAMISSLWSMTIFEQTKLTAAFAESHLQFNCGVGHLMDEATSEMELRNKYICICMAFIVHNAPLHYLVHQGMKQSQLSAKKKEKKKESKEADFFEREKKSNSLLLDSLECQENINQASKIM